MRAGARPGLPGGGAETQKLPRLSSLPSFLSWSWPCTNNCLSEISWHCTEPLALVQVRRVEESLIAPARAALQCCLLIAHLRLSSLINHYIKYINEMTPFCSHYDQSDGDGSGIYNYLAPGFYSSLKRSS